MSSVRFVRTSGVVVVSAAASLAFAAGQAGPAATTGGIDAAEHAPFVPGFRLEAMMGDDELVPPMHPPIELIPPIPMPNPDFDIPDRFGGPGNVWVYDVETRRITEMPVPWGDLDDGRSGWGGGFIGADGLAGHDDMYAPRDFGTMFLLNQSQVQVHPFRMNAKLVMEFTDAGNGSRVYFVGSAGMQDAEVVLTAGHCVYNRSNDSTGNDYGFASRVWVYPGWDGNGLVLGEPGVLNHYGWARSETFAAWTGYTIDGNYDWDMGLIRVGRAVGMLTGWYAWRWGGDCTTLFYNNPSYPSESCGQPGLHNGQDMYNWGGHFDSCPGNQMQIDTTPGCFTALWGGQSGSNAYDIVGETRYAHGVASNSNRTTVGRYAKMWEGLKNYMEDTFKPAARGTAFDLQALQCRADQDTILAGTATTGAKVQIPNPTNNNPPSQSYFYTVYLSTNSTITTADTPLSNQTYTYDYGAMQNLTVNMVNPTIPKNTPTGTYWMGIALNPGTDANDTNNATNLWDAHQVFVNGFADVAADSCSAPSGTVYHGDSMNVGYSVTNEGGNSSTAVTIDFYASTNTIISTADTFLGSASLGTFAGSQTKTGSVNVTIPSSILGNRYIGYIITASNDYDTTNNTAYDAVALTVDGRADLSANYLTVLDTQVYLGRQLPTRSYVQNFGTIPSGGYTVDYYASTNTIISPADTLLGSYSRSSLGVGSGVLAFDSPTIPGFMSPGNYYVGMIVSPGTNENATGDNTAYDSNRVSIQNCLVDFNNDGVLDLADIIFFVTAFQNQDPIADFDGNNIWDLADIVAFVTAFQNGCP